MKNIVYTLIFSLMTIMCFGQSIGVGTSTPDPSATIDMSSVTQGMLVPRMTSTQRVMISAPAVGLLVFDLTTGTFWFRDASAWTELVPGGDTEVHRTGPDQIHMGITDSVGIGTMDPHYKLEVKTAQNQYGIAHTGGGVEIATWTGGGGGEIGTVTNHPFRLYANNGLNQFNLLQNGNVGIGLTPQNRLDIHTGPSRTGSLHPSNLPLYVTGNIGQDTSGIEFRHYNGTQGIGFGYAGMYAAGSNENQNLGISAKGLSGHLAFSTNNMERFRVSGTGNVGIGTTNPLQRLHVSGNALVSLALGIGTDEMNAPLQFSNASLNRKMVLFELENNNHQFSGLGTNASTLRYQTASTSIDHVFYSASSSTSSNELMRVKGSGNVSITGSIDVETMVAPTFQNGFTNWGNGYATAGYYKDKMGRVHLKGVVTRPSSSEQLVIFTLPAGYRPTSGRQIFSVLNDIYTSQIDIHSNGNVVVLYASVGALSLNGISFKAD